MALFTRITAIYFLAAITLTLVLREKPLELLSGMLSGVPNSVRDVFVPNYLVILAIILALVVIDRHLFLQRIKTLVIMTFACSIFMMSFSIIKNALPLIVPFWADPMLRDLDAALHFGTDPWRLTHEVFPWQLFSANQASLIYYFYWGIPAVYLPAILATFDPDPRRVRRFIGLHLFFWIGLGNIVALSFMSVGPVFYDQLLATDAFGGLMAALRDDGYIPGFHGSVLEYLWHNHSADAQRVGTGISAFPSVHVAGSVVFALYLIERSRIFLIPGVAIIAFYQFYSVHLGLHYAIDGYFSIIAVILVWVTLKRVGTSISLTRPGAAPKGLSQ